MHVSMYIYIYIYTKKKYMYTWLSSIYSCNHVHTCTCTGYKHTNIHKDAQMYTSTYAHAYIHRPGLVAPSNVCMHIYAWEYTYIHTYMHIYMLKVLTARTHVCICIHTWSDIQLPHTNIRQISTHIHIHACMHKHVYIYIHIHIWCSLQLSPTQLLCKLWPLKKL
jgi:hypothetical protein